MLLSPEKTAANPAPATPPTTDQISGADLHWVWTEVRKRVFLKLSFSRVIADALESVVPIALDGDMFICGLPARDYIYAAPLQTDQVRNTIESILKQAAGRNIHFDVIEGSTLRDWQIIKERRQRAQEAVIAMAQQHAEIHHYEDLLNQIVSEIRQRVTSTKDRLYPQVRANLILDIAPLLASAEEMLFDPDDMHHARRALARAIDRVAGFLEIPPITLALEIERHHREHGHAGIPSKQTNV